MSKWTPKELAILTLYDTTVHIREFFTHCPPEISGKEILEIAIKGERDPNLIKNSKIVTDVWDSMKPQIVAARTSSRNEKYLTEQSLFNALELARENYMPFYFTYQPSEISLEEKAAVLLQLDDDMNLGYFVMMEPLLRRKKFIRLAFKCKGERLRNAFAAMCALKVCIKKNIEISDGLGPTMEFRRVIQRAAGQVSTLKQITPDMLKAMELIKGDV